MTLRRAIHGALALLAMTASLARAEDASRPANGRQSLDDAWWTGSMLAPSAATLPRGHFLIEPYFFDVIGKGRYDQGGKRRTTARSNGFGSLTYMLYGVADRLTVGFIPTAGFNTVSGAPSRSSVGLGDLTLHAEYGLTRFHQGRWVPATAIVVQEGLPTGKYDRLGDRPTDGLGTGAHTTTLAFFSQTYFWLPNGRILRMRVDVSRSFSRSVNVRGVSVYGTGSGFRGRAAPGGSFLVDGSWEYSLKRSWALALDVTYRRDASTRVTGSQMPHPGGAPGAVGVNLDSGSSEAFGFAPAVEYSWTPNLGVLVGARLIAGGRNTAASITPAVAINFVH